MNQRADFIIPECYIDHQSRGDIGMARVGATIRRLISGCQSHAGKVCRPFRRGHN